MKRSRRLSRRTLIVLASLAGMVVTANLGFWQLRRAAQKQALVDARSTQQARPALDGEALGAVGDSAENRQGLLYRRVDLRGQWVPEHTVFLDNRQMHGHPGFFVVTPLRLSGSGAVLAVQRGWVPRNFRDRTALPEVQTPSAEVHVLGQLTPWPSRLYDFGEEGQGPLRQNLDFVAYRQQTGLPLLELSVQQTGPQDDALLRDWPVIASGVETHYGYAFQWFGLSALIALLYVWFQIVQPRRQRPTV